MDQIKRHCGAGAVLACLALLTVSAPAGAATSVAASGTFAEPAPPVLTSYDAKNGAFSGYGASTWTGTWTGSTYWTIKGTINLLTGDSSGTLDETFIGRSGDGGTGTLYFTETYTVNGATGAFHDNATLVRGTGDFAGSSGKVTFSGLDLPSGQGEGTYTGTWIRGPITPAGGHPEQPPPSRHPNPASAPHLRVSVSPRTVKAGQRERFRFRVSAGGRPVSHAWVVLDGRRAQTSRAGRATLLIRLPHAGRYRVIALHVGMTVAYTFVHTTGAPEARGTENAS